MRPLNGAQIGSVDPAIIRQRFLRQFAARRRRGVIPRFPFFRGFDAGWSSPVARQAHNLKVVGSNPTPATKKGPVSSVGWRGLSFRIAPSPIGTGNQAATDDVVAL